MEGNGLSGKMYSNAGVGVLGLDVPLHKTASPQNPQVHLQKHQQQMMASAHHPLHHLQQHHEQQTQLSMKQPTNYISYNNLNQNPNLSQNQCLKTKTQLTNSDEDEPGCANDLENTSIHGKTKGGSNISPWQRMKWTDNMVRLLIMAVYYIGDEVGNEVGPEKKSGSGGTGGGGLLQKKGKWKSVSKAMMEKGFYVSPQQCEDKFNDLNKRYKRVNDILGKGTACKVVENQALLDTMDLSPKMKEEVRKLLNSKHLFFREMCAYHKSCGHGAGGTTTNDATVNSVSVAEVQHNLQSVSHQLQQHQKQSCLHSAAIAASSIEHEDEEEDDDDEEDDEEEDEDEEVDEEHDEGGGPRKRARTAGSMSSNSQALQQLNGEIMGMLQDVGKNPWEKKQWMKTQLVQLEEQGLKFQFQALELEKQRLKWIRFSSKKEREMEKLKIDNERKRLENERMLLLVRRKEIELLGEQTPSCVSS